MKRASIVIAVLIQSCSMDATPDTHDARPLDSKHISERHKTGEHGTLPSQSHPVRNDTCSATLARAEQVEDGSKLSAFLTFNEYPPSQNQEAPSDVDIASIRTDFTGLMACIEGTPFNFNVLVDGVLEKGEAHMISPLTAWKVPDGHLAFYLHKNYEDTDGEGEAVEISGIYMDTLGNPTKYIQGASSWYEYEGSIRIRNFYYLNDQFVTTEEVFDPSDQDESGNVLDYMDSPQKSIIKVHTSFP